MTFCVGAPSWGDDIGRLDYFRAPDESIAAGGLDDVAPLIDVADDFTLTETSRRLRASIAELVSLDAEAQPGSWQFQHGGNVRALYVHDGRVEFMGTESTFVAEAAWLGRMSHRLDCWTFSAVGQLFLTEPFGRNILVDHPVRASFAHNFQQEPLEISQLYLCAQTGALCLKMGRFATPFGWYEFPVLLNSFNDTPFLRSEAIHFRETGCELDWRPGRWELTGAITNGGVHRDANSSKALVARVGRRFGDWIAGGSIKTQDGIGSESQKEFNSHVGIDLRWEPSPCWTIGGEVVYDEYGLRRPGFPLDDIRWGRSLYNRQLNRALNQPLTGIGWHVNAWRRGPRWDALVGFGVFTPDPVGDPIHDQINRRGIIKCIRHYGPHWDWHVTAMVEDSLKNAFVGRPRHGFFIASGLEIRY
jgi:hypothetical protein